MNTEITQKENRYKKLIIALSIVIPVAVAILFGIKIEGFDTKFLPPIYASINGLTAIVLLLAIWMIKQGNRKTHEYLMKFAILLSTFFLVLYVVYHITNDSTPYGGEGTMKYLYFFILISHILLSIVVIPFVLFTYLRAILFQFENHTK